MMGSAVSALQGWPVAFEAPDNSSTRTDSRGHFVSVEQRGQHRPGPVFDRRADIQTEESTAIIWRADGGGFVARRHQVGPDPTATSARPAVGGEPTHARPERPCPSGLEPERVAGLVDQIHWKIERGAHTNQCRSYAS